MGKCKECLCSTNKIEIEKLFSEKLNPAIAPALEKRNTTTGQRQQIEADHAAFTAKIDATGKTIKELEETLDARVVAGKGFDDITAKIAAKQAEIAAYKRHLQRLGDKVREARLTERKATDELSVAIGKALEELRPDVQALIEEKIWDVVGTLVSFESSAREVCSRNGATLQKDLELSVFRFLGLDRVQKHLEAFTGAIGDDFSVIRRREASEHFFALMDERARKDAA